MDAPKRDGEIETIVPGTTDERSRTNGNALAVRSDEAVVVDVRRSLPAAIEQFKAITEYVKQAMVEGEDFGRVEGIAKPFLFKSGAEKLSTLFGYAPVYVTLERVEDWGERKQTGFFFYRYRCDLTSKRTGVVMGSGIGSCNSYEDRYRWIGGKRKCPACGAETIIKGRMEYGGGWVCWSKTLAACGAKYAIDATEITGQSVERVEREAFSLVNTIDKMAQKRALVAAALIATGTSAMFTQDEETFEAVEPRAPETKATTAATNTTAAVSAPPPAPARSEAVAPNQFAGKCLACGGWVEKMAGVRVKDGDGRWRAQHSAGGCKPLPSAATEISVLAQRLGFTHDRLEAMARTYGATAPDWTKASDEVHAKLLGVLADISAGAK